MRKTNLLLVLLIVSAVFFCATGVASAISLSDKYVGNTVVDLEWTVYGGSFSKYKLYRDDALIHTEFNRDNIFYRDEGPSKGVTYVYKIEVYDDEGGLWESETRYHSITTGDVHGRITLDTTWTAASSPYTLTRTVLVEEKATLTIQSGVTVNVSPYCALTGTIAPLDTVTFNGNEIHLENVNGYSIENCVFNGGGIYLENVNGYSIKNCVFNTSHIILHKCNNFIISNNIIENYSWYGIRLDTSSDNILSDNTVNNNSHDGIGVYGISLVDSSSNNITDNIANNNRYGIWLRFSSNNMLTGNIANNNSEYGIHLEYSSDNTFTSNSVNDCDVGIHLEYSSDNTFTSNSVNNHRDHGIYLKWSSDNNTFTSNSVNNNGGDALPGSGIYTGIFLSSDNNTFTNNSVNNNNDGIRMSSSSNNTFTDNTFNNNSRYGIYISHSSDNTFTNNSANDCDVGIHLGDSSDNTFTSNSVNNHRDGGINLKWSSDNNTFTSNTFNNNGDDDISLSESGIYLYESSDNTFTNNTIMYNSNDGIKLVLSSNNTFTDNIANNNSRYGISLSKSSDNTFTDNIANNNDDYGIWLWFSSNNNTIYNNYFNNTHNAYDDGNNIWNIAKTPGTSIAGGPYLGGNCWSDYIGSDTDEDRLGDTLLPYNSSGRIINGGDYHPLLIPIDDLSIESKDVVAPDKVEVDTIPEEVQIVEIEATVHNNGIYDVPNVEVQLNITFRDKTTPIQKETIDKIAAGSSATVTFEWEVLKWVKDNLENLCAEDQGGTLKAEGDVEKRLNFVYVEVIVDPENKIIEFDETNNRALAESEKTFLIVIPDVEITRIEPIQVIEYVPLIKDKPMMTRVWVELKDGKLFAEAHNVRVKVEFDDGNPAQELEMCLINHKEEGEKYVTYVVPENQVAAFKEVMEKPYKLKEWLFRHGSQAFNFEFDGRNPRPVGNKLVITASLQNGDSDENNNILKSPAANVKPTTLDDNKLDILYKPVDSLFTYHKKTVAQHKQLMKKHAAFIEATYPVVEVRAFYSDDRVEQYLPPKDPYTMVSFFSLEKARMVKKGSYYCDYGGFDRVVWVVPYQALGVGIEGEARPLAGRGVFVDERAKLHLSAHEIGHTYGLAGWWLWWGYKEEYDDDHNAFYVADNGWDVKGEVSRWMTTERTKRPKYSYDLGKDEVMSNCNYQTFMGNPLVDQPWITLWNYQLLMDKLVSGGSDPRLLLVSGEIYEDDSVEFDPFFEIEGVPDEVPSGDYFFECIAGNGTVLSSTSYNSSVEAYNGTSYFGFTIVYPEGTAKVVLRHNDTLLKEVVISPSAPVIAIDSVEDLGNENYEVTWIGTDADGDDLEYLFFFSSNGELWFPLEDELIEDAPTCTLKFNSLSMAGGNESWVKIVATDGVNTVEALSEPFSVPTKPPSASIISPRDGSVFNQEDEIDFDGFGYDRDIGLLNGSTFVWTSSIDGEIGRGDYFTLSNLSLGGHQITITVTDGEGKTANASVNITIVKTVINEVSISKRYARR
jgi:parallel beta-helix repeat protein